VTAPTVQREALGAFLRSRREHIEPRAAGLAPGRRRRTPGLRREEVAQLAGVSVTWYTWLEQARDIGVSREVIDGLTCALQLSTVERTHLFTLAGLAPPGPVQAATVVDPALERLVHAQSPHPCYLMDAWWNLLAYNTAYAALAGDVEARSPEQRNVLWLTFTGARIHDEWAAHGHRLVGQLRANLARFPHDARGPALVESLLAASPAFAQLWRAHVVQEFEGASKRLTHPTLGALTFDTVKLVTPGDESLALLVLLPADDATAAKLPALAR
jgi:hypothetical protein